MVSVEINFINSMIALGSLLILVMLFFIVNWSIDIIKKWRIKAKARREIREEQKAKEAIKELEQEKEKITAPKVITEKKTKYVF